MREVVASMLLMRITLVSDLHLVRNAFPSIVFCNARNNSRFTLQGLKADKILNEYHSHRGADLIGERSLFMSHLQNGNSS